MAIAGILCVDRPMPRFMHHNKRLFLILVQCGVYSQCLEKWWTDGHLCARAGTSVEGNGRTARGVTLGAVPVVDAGNSIEMVAPCYEIGLNSGTPSCATKVRRERGIP